MASNAYWAASRSLNSAYVCSKYVGFGFSLFAEGRTISF